jgi:tetratricopeptide (TPR) repeat protein
MEPQHISNTARTMQRPAARRARSRVLAGALAAVAALFVASAAVGCGDKKPANVPTSPADGAAGDSITNDQGQAVSTQGPEEHAGLTGDAKTAYDQAFQKWMVGDLAGAKDGFRSAADKAPKAGAPHYSLGCVLERLGDVAGAQGEYRTAFTVAPSYDIAIGALAISLANSGHRGEAETFLDDQIKKNPESVPLLVFMGEVQSLKLDANGSSAAQRYAQDALSKDSSYVPAMLLVARDYLRQRRYDLARAAVQAILDGSDQIPAKVREDDMAHRSEWAQAKLLRGLIARDTLDRKTAFDNFDAASSKRPDLYEASVNLGEMRLEAGNAAGAQAPLESAMKYAPNVAVIHLDLGDCYRLLGRPADAKREFDTALSMDSGLSGVHYDLGLLYLYGQNVPGMSNPEDQVNMALTEFQKYKDMKGKLPRGQNDDVDQLISTAKEKKDEMARAKAGAATAAASSSAAAPAPSASAGKP